MLTSTWNRLPSEAQRPVTPREQMPRTISQELTAELIAGDLKDTLLNAGQQCIAHARSALLWAVHEDPGADQGIAEQAAEVSILEIEWLLNFISRRIILFVEFQLVTCVNGMRDFVPGSQIVSTLNSLVDELPVPRINGTNGHVSYDGDSQAIAAAAKGANDGDDLFAALRNLADVSLLRLLQYIIFECVL